MDGQDGPQTNPKINYKCPELIGEPRQYLNGSSRSSNEGHPGPYALDRPIKVGGHMLDFCPVQYGPKTVSAHKGRKLHGHQIWCMHGNFSWDHRYTTWGPNALGRGSSKILRKAQQIYLLCFFWCLERDLFPLDEFWLESYLLGMVRLR